MTCPIPCQCELLHNCAHSSGPLQNLERVARGAFDPRHINSKHTNIKRAFIEKKSLAESEFSVWRLDPAQSLPIENLVSILRNRTDLGNLAVIFSVGVEEIRNLKSADEERRVFRVYDCSRYTQQGDTNPFHAHIGLCRELPKSYFDRDSEDFQFLVDQLFFVFNSATSRTIEWTCDGDTLAGLTAKN